MKIFYLRKCHTIISVQFYKFIDFNIVKLTILNLKNMKTYLQVQDYQENKRSLQRY